MSQKLLQCFFLISVLCTLFYFSSSLSTETTPLYAQDGAEEDAPPISLPDIEELFQEEKTLLEKRFYTLKFYEQKAGVATFCLYQLENGSTLIEFHVVIIIQREIQGEIDIFRTEKKDFELYDTEYNLLEKKAFSLSNEILESRHTTINKLDPKEPKLLYSYQDPYTEFEKSFDLPENFKDEQELFHNGLKEYKEKDSAAFEYQSFDPESLSFKKKTFTFLGTKKITFQEQLLEAYEVTFGEEANKAHTTTFLLTENGLPVNADFSGVIQLEWTQENSLQNFEGASINSLLPAQGTIKNWQAISELQLEIKTQEDQSRSDLFKSNAYQEVTRKGSSYSLKLKNGKKGMDFKAPQLPLTIKDPEVANFLEPTPLCQSGHQEIIEQAKKILDNTTDSLEALTKILAWMSRNLTQESGMRGAASALETLHAKQGDCTEHTALSVALCRAIGIPARNVSGMVYMVDQGKAYFGFHAWSEAWLGEWVSFDATTSEIGTPARYIFFKYNEPEHEENSDTLVRCLQPLHIQIKSYQLFNDEQEYFLDQESSSSTESKASEAEPQKAQPENKKGAENPE